MTKEQMIDTQKRYLEALGGDAMESVEQTDCWHEGGDEPCMEEHGYDQDEVDDLNSDVNRAAETIERAIDDVKEYINSQHECDNVDCEKCFGICDSCQREIRKDCLEYCSAFSTEANQVCNDCADKAEGK